MVPRPLPTLLIALTGCTPLPLPDKPPGDAALLDATDGGTPAEGEGEGAAEGEGEGAQDRAFGERCTGNSDCRSAWCAVTQDGAGRCTLRCVPIGEDTCPDDWHCTMIELGGVDREIVPLCWPGLASTLCQGCQGDEDCGGGGALCVEQEGRTFCGRACEGELDASCPNGYVCRHIEAAARWQCLPEFGACCDVGGPGAREVCNRLDDDCDGQTDEGFDVGAACSDGQGECLQEGENVCREDGEGTRCGVVADQPGDELCGDGRDNDCDGHTDEDFDLGLGCEEGDGICRRGGQTVCSDDRRSIVCNASPARPLDQELCGNAEDDDCDGETDEGFDVGAACTVGLGICERAGQTLCSPDRTATVCNVQPGVAETELCGDLLDEDCDGALDNGFDLGAVCVVGVGACERAGIRVCAEDRQSAGCSVEPGPVGAELCGNNVDDDCNGETDEGFDLGASCTSGLGACAVAGVKECAPGGVGTRCDAVAADSGSDEVCGNDVDEDCDGALDNGFDLGAPCSDGVGACERQGQLICAAGGTTTECTAEAAAPGDHELCDNGADDDCNGETDEGFPLLGTVCYAGLGPCRNDGTYVCTADRLETACNAVAHPGPPPLQFPIPEYCGTGIDEDCDGVVDEADCRFL